MRASKNRNRACKKLKEMIDEVKNQEIQGYLEDVTPTEATDSVWKATKRLKKPQQSIDQI